MQRKTCRIFSAVLPCGPCRRTRSRSPRSPRAGPPVPGWPLAARPPPARPSGSSSPWAPPCRPACRAGPARRAGSRRRSLARPLRPGPPGPLRSPRPGRAARAGLSPATRRRARLAALAVGAFLVPWSVMLSVTLPSAAQAHHWSMAWTGLDAAEALAALATAVLLARGDARASLTAVAGGPCWSPMPGSTCARRPPASITPSRWPGRPGRSFPWPSPRSGWPPGSCGAPGRSAPDSRRAGREPDAGRVSVAYAVTKMYGLSFKGANQPPSLSRPIEFRRISCMLSRKWIPVIAGKEFP